MHRRKLASVCAAALAAAALSQPAAAQARPFAWKIRPHLADAMAKAGPRDRLPVYFVMRDRLGYNHWFPRVNALDLDQRRALVVAELQEHARRTQRRLCGLLGGERDRGEARRVRSSWLGNYVRAEASVAAIDRAAALDDVWEVWPDDPVSGEACEDAAPAPAAIPGSGPKSVRADLCWAFGFAGQGVVVMNADSGINVLHRALEPNLWQNPGEIPGNGIDDDQNGFVDDIYGWNFADNNSDLEDFGGHGTATAGVLVGGTCAGITLGIAPLGLVMTGKLATETDQWQAVQYAILMGADTQTSSHSYKNDFVPPPNYAMHRDVGEISLAAGLIRTNSTSNSGAECQSGIFELRRPFNVSAPGNLPPPYLDPNQLLVGRKGGVIGVGAYTLPGGNLDPGSPCGPSSWYLPDLLAVLPAYPLEWWDPRDNDYPWEGGAQPGLLKPDVVAPTGTTTSFGMGVTCNAAVFGGTSNSTPIVNGCMMLWKGANPSLTPEDMAMIVHQTSHDAGRVPGKENNWGAGRIDAFDGLLRALAVHRVDGEPAWAVAHRSGTPITFEIDGSPDKPVLIALGLVRQDFDFGIVTSGIGSQLFQVFAGSTGPTGTVRVQIPVPEVSRDFRVFSQAFIDDRTGKTFRFLASNVIQITLQP